MRYRQTPFWYKALIYLSRLRPPCGSMNQKAVVAVALGAGSDWGLAWDRALVADCETKAPTLDPDDHVHGVKCGLQIFEYGLVLTLKLLDMLIELPRRSADLLRNQIGAVLQVATDVTHLMFPQRSTHGAQTTKPGSSSG